MAACDEDILCKGPPVKKQKRAVCRKTVEKWIVENDRTLNTAAWLKFETDRRDHMLSLKCAVCSQFKERLTSMRKYRPAFIEGTTNVRTSTFKDHAATDMHARAMTLFRKQHASHITEYSPIAAALQRSSMDATTTTRYYIPLPGIGNGRRARIRTIVILADSPRQCFHHQESVERVRLRRWTREAKTTYLALLCCKVSSMYCITRHNLPVVFMHG